LALQYFATEASIFNFQRDAKAFVLMACILVFTLPLFSLAVKYMQKFGSTIVERLMRKMGRSHPKVDGSEITEVELQPYSEKRIV
jgi:hypothetical protein